MPTEPADIVATKGSRIGVSRGSWKDARLTVDAVRTCQYEEPAEVIIGWLDGARAGVIAVDSPLGWPRPLAAALSGHKAGCVVKAAADELFKRTTDREIHRLLGKMPLEVGADRIARTAYSALQLLEAVRSGLKASIPLAWDWSGISGIEAIEVYPAATLAAHGLRVGGYQKEEGAALREEILRHLQSELDLQLPASDTRLLNSNVDALDSVVCLLAAEDFLVGRAAVPANLDLARDEGWIWVATRA